MVPFAALLALWFAPRAASPAARAFAAASLAIVVWLVARGRDRSRRSRRWTDRGAEHVLRRAARADRARRPRRRRRRRRAGAGRWSRPPRSRACCRCSSRSAASSRRAPSRTRSRCCRGGGCRTTGSTSTRCAGLRCAVAVAAAALFVLAAAAVRARAAGARRRATSSRRRSWSRTGATASTRPRSARSGPGSASRTPTGSTAPSGRDALDRLRVDRRRDRRGDLGERVLQPQLRAGVRDRPARRPDPLPETAVVAARRRPARRAAASSCAREYVLADGSTDVEGRVVARDPGVGLTLYRVDGPLVAAGEGDGPLPDDTWSGEDGHLPARSTAAAAACRSRSAATRRCSRGQLTADRRSRVVARTGRRSSAARARRFAPRPGTATTLSSSPLPGRARAVATARCTRHASRVGAHGRPVARVVKGGDAAAALGAHFLRFDYRPMRIAFDVSPLSHERTGVNNYIRGSLAGLAAAAQRDGHEVVAFAPTSPEGRRVIPEALDGHPGRAAARDAARRARLAHGLVAARLAAGRALARRASTCSTSPTGCTRRSATACARRRSTTSCRCTSRSG